MAKDWEYAKITKWIAEHGGPQKALEIVENYYTKKGFKEGAASKNPVIILASIVSLGVGIAGKGIYDKIKEKKALETKNEAIEQVKVKKAEDELVSAMTHDTADRVEAVDEPES